MEATFETQLEPRPGRITRLRIRLRRGRLDDLLIAGTDPNRGSLLIARARQLTSASHRAETAALLERMINSADERFWRPNGAVNVQHDAVRLAGPDIERVVERLRGTQPVSPQGVAMVHHLLGDGAGPLYYDSGDERRLTNSVRKIDDALRHGPALQV